jgi:hypothetical protein
MHYQLLLRLMHHHGLGVLFNDPLKGPHLRKLLLSSVLATDMSVHHSFMERLQRRLFLEQGTLCSRQTLLMQAILKCADISNPVCASSLSSSCIPYALHVESPLSCFTILGNGLDERVVETGIVREILGIQTVGPRILVPFERSQVPGVLH